MTYEEFQQAMEDLGLYDQMLDAEMSTVHSDLVRVYVRIFGQNPQLPPTRPASFPSRTRMSAASYREAATRTRAWVRLTAARGWNRDAAIYRQYVEYSQRTPLLFKAFFTNMPRSRYYYRMLATGMSRLAIGSRWANWQAAWRMYFHKTHLTSCR